MVTGRHGPIAPEVMATRITYDVPGMADDEIEPDPLNQFRRWFEDAAAAGISEPNAMSLATCGPDGPSVRVVLAKSVDRHGLSFYTNLASDKAREIEHDPRVSAVFAYITQHRQIRVRGRATPLPREVVATYFADRPRGAQIGAWASRQSQAMSSRAELGRRVAEVERRFPGEIPLPDFWGGYLIEADDVEFWQGQPSRLHDRLRYERVQPGALLDEPAGWRVVRLFP